MGRHLTHVYRMIGSGARSDEFGTAAALRRFSSFNMPLSLASLHWLWLGFCYLVSGLVLKCLDDWNLVGEGGREGVGGSRDGKGWEYGREIGEKQRNLKVDV